VLAQRAVADPCAEAAVGVDGADLHACLLRLRYRALQQAVVGRVAAAAQIDDHEALCGVGDTCLVAKLGRAPGAAHPDRASVRVDARDPPVGDRALAGETQISLSVADLFLTKPFSPVQLLAAIERLLRRAA
jgi:CheY-like chemotaxis protein